MADFTVTSVPNVPATGNTTAIARNPYSGRINLFSSTGLILRSDNNGLTWASVAATGANATAYARATFGNNLIVGVGDTINNFSISIAADGDHFTQVNSGTGAAHTSVAYGNGIFIVTQNTTSIVSTDGSIWNGAGSHGMASPILAFGNGVFVAAETSINPTIMITTDGLTWFDVTPAAAVQPHSDVIFANGWFFITSNVGEVWASQSGSTWIQVPIDSPSGQASNNMVSPMFLGNKWIFVSNSNRNLAFVTLSGTEPTAFQESTTDTTMGGWPGTFTQTLSYNGIGITLVSNDLFIFNGVQATINRRTGQTKILMMGETRDQLGLPNAYIPLALNDDGSLQVTDALAPSQQFPEQNIFVEPTTPLISLPYIYYNAQWTRYQGNSVITLLTNSARTAAVSSSMTDNPNATGLTIFLDINAVAVSGTVLTLRLQGQPFAGADVSTCHVFYPILAQQSQFMFQVFPGIDGGNVSLPGRWRINITPSDANSVTYALYSQYIL